VQNHQDYNGGYTSSSKEIVFIPPKEPTASFVQTKEILFIPTSQDHPDSSDTAFAPPTPSYGRSLGKSTVIAPRRRSSHAPQKSSEDRTPLNIQFHENEGHGGNGGKTMSSPFSSKAEACLETSRKALHTRSPKSLKDKVSEISPGKPSAVIKKNPRQQQLPFLPPLCLDSTETDAHPHAPTRIEDKEALQDSNEKIQPRGDFLSLEPSWRDSPKKKRDTVVVSKVSSTNVRSPSDGKSSTRKAQVDLRRDPIRSRAYENKLKRRSTSRAQPSSESTCCPSPNHKSTGDLPPLQPKVPPLPPSSKSLPVDSKPRSSQLRSISPSSKKGRRCSKPSSSENSRTKCSSSCSVSPGVLKSALPPPLNRDMFRLDGSSHSCSGTTESQKSTISSVSPKAMSIASGENRNRSKSRSRKNRSPSALESRRGSERPGIPIPPPRDAVSRRPGRARSQDRKSASYKSRSRSEPRSSVNVPVSTPPPTASPDSKWLADSRSLHSQSSKSDAASAPRLPRRKLSNEKLDLGDDGSSIESTDDSWNKTWSYEEPPISFTEHAD